MNRIWFWFLILCLWPMQAQVSPRPIALKSVLVLAEKQLGVHYSFPDVLVEGKTLVWPVPKIDLEGFHRLLSGQGIAVQKIGAHYFALVEMPTAESPETVSLSEVVVGAFLTDGIAKTNQKYTLCPQKSEPLAGVTDSDVLLSLQQLPGVQSPNETATGLYVRGGTQDQNLLLLDGIRLYHPGHLFGMISGINPNVVRRVGFYTKGISARYGERASAVIDLESGDELAERPRVVAGVNTLNADGFLQLPIVRGKLDVQLSGRKSLTEIWRSPTFNALAAKVFQHTDFQQFDNRNEFNFYDYSAKVLYKPSANTTLGVMALSINNQLDYRYRLAPDSTSTQRMGVRNDGYGVHWQQRFSDRLSARVSGSYSVYDFGYSKRQQQESGPFFEVFQKRNRIVDSGADCRFTQLIGTDQKLEFGYQMAGHDVSHLFNTYNQDIGIDLNQRQLFNVTHSVYASDILSLGSWRFEAGFRYNALVQLHTQTVEPRVFVQKKITAALAVQVSYDRRNQFMSQARESSINDLSLENYVWVLADGRKYPIQASDQYALGVVYKKHDWLLDVDAYHKTLRGLTALNLGFSGPGDAQITFGESRTDGVDVFLQKKAGPWRVAATYAFQDSELHFEGMNRGRYFSATSNINHSVNLNVNRRWKQFSAAIGWFWHTGRPYSAVNDRGGTEAFEAGRLPVYHRLDFSCDYTFSSGKTKFRTGVSVYNLYNRRTTINREYERRYQNFADLNAPRYVAQDYRSLGLMPNVYFRVVL